MDTLTSAGYRDDTCDVWAAQRRAAELVQNAPGNEFPSEIPLRFEFTYYGQPWTYEGCVMGYPHFAWRGCVQPFSLAAEAACIAAWREKKS